jgi:hypothetical protein
MATKMIVMVLLLPAAAAVIGTTGIILIYYRKLITGRRHEDVEGDLAGNACGFGCTFLTGMEVA